MAEDIPSDIPIPASDDSIDALVQWIAANRSRCASGRLIDLVDLRRLSLPSVVEIACIDLISLHRCDHDAVVEDYIEQFPQLADEEELLLDLIDAEICVRKERGEPEDLTEWMARFPNQATAISQLLSLEDEPESIVPSTGGRAGRTGDTPTVFDESISHSFASELSIPAGEGTVAFDVEPISVVPSSDQFADSSKPQRERTVPKSYRRRRLTGLQGETIETPIPIRTPDWIAGAKCVTTAKTPLGRYWLLTGRDTHRGDTVAMKVLPIPPTVSHRQKTQMLDLCEIASQVIQPGWVAPRVAAISNGYLAVVRPWVFGTPYRSMIPQLDADRLLRDLIKLAFTLSAAHRAGATHGYVSEQNVIVDHQSNVTLVDATSSLLGWTRCLSQWQGELDEFLDARIHLDTISLMQMIASRCIDDVESYRVSWITDLMDGLQPGDPDCCVTIGERLQQHIEQGSHLAKKKSWWRR